MLISALKLDEEYRVRPWLNEDAIRRYVDLFDSGKEKPVVVQAKTLRVIDGFHRVEAAKRKGLEKISVVEVDVEDSDIRALAYKYNRAHGVPLSREERNKVIVDLYVKDGKTQAQIAQIVGLSRNRVSEILASCSPMSVSDDSEHDVESADKRKKITEQDKVTIVKLLLGGETQRKVAQKFGVSSSTVNTIWAKFRDHIHDLYTRDQFLKREVAEETNLTMEEVDKILQEYGDPLNFEPMMSTWWPAFGLDDRFGKKHSSNLPADLVRNILALYTKPGDIILDPAAGGGVVLDVARDMVHRKCFAYDLVPQRDDVKTHNILVEPPSEPAKPNLIFLDLPYGPAKSGEYSLAHSSDLANKSPSEFLEDLARIFGYWDNGTLVVLMSSYRSEGELVDLPFEAEKRMVNAGWKIVEHIVNEHGRVKSETGFWVDKAKEERWLLRKHIHILVGKK